MVLASFARIDDNENAIFEFEKFYFTSSTRSRGYVDIRTNGDACAATNAFDGRFVQGADNIVVGQRGSRDIRLDIFGVVDGKINSYSVTIPSKSGETNLTSIESDEYLERLWAFLTVKKILGQQSPADKIGVRVSGPRRADCQDGVFSRFGFVTDLTSLIVTEKDGWDSDYRIRFPPLPPTPTTEVKFIKKILDPTACKGSLILYTQTYLRGLDLELKDSEANIQDFSTKVSSMKITGEAFWRMG